MAGSPKIIALEVRSVDEEAYACTGGKWLDKTKAFTLEGAKAERIKRIESEIADLEADLKRLKAALKKQPTIVPAKKALGLEAPSLLFKPVPTKNGVVGIEWRGVCEYKAEDLLKTADGPADELAKAMDFLLNLLAQGPVRQPAVKAKAKVAGLKWRTVERAKEVLGGKSNRDGWGPGSKWYWSLPKQDKSDGDDKE